MEIGSSRTVEFSARNIGVAESETRDGESDANARGTTTHDDDDAGDNDDDDDCDDLLDKKPSEVITSRYSRLKPSRGGHCLRSNLSLNRFPAS